MNSLRSVMTSLVGCLALAIFLACGAWAQTSKELPSAPDPQTTAPAANSGTSVGHAPAAEQPRSRRDEAEQQIQTQERQRILGVIPNFNTSYIQNAAPLDAGQKIRLALNSSLDPFQFVAAAAYAGYDQATNNFSGYGQGAQGYGKRFGAQYADQVSGNMWGNAIFPILLHEDPRYFRKGTGSFKSRLYYAVMTTFKTKNDDGSWGFNYANILGNLVAGGLSNLYYPSSDRGVGLTFEGAARVTALGAVGAAGVEFWPDIDRRVFHKHKADPQAADPAK